MSKTSKVCFALLILCTAVNFVLSFNVQPDLPLWSWFGYKFGFTVTGPLLPLKIIALALMGVLIYDNGFKKALAN